MPQEHLLWSLYLFEFGYFSLTLLCLRHAWKQAPYKAFSLIVAILYGFAVEYSAVIRDPAPYHYNFFLIELPGPVPLGAILGWGIIFYVVTETATKLKSHWSVQAMFAAMLATCVDLVVDPIVVYVGFWTWTPQGPWFGIPWGNYVGWVVIVASLSVFLQLGYKKFPPGQKFGRDILVALGATIPAFISVYILLTGYLILTTKNWIPEVVIANIFLGACLLFLLYNLPAMNRDNPIEWELLSVPAFFFPWSLIMLYLSGFYNLYPELIIVFPVFIALGLTGFFWPNINKILLKHLDSR